MFFSSCLTPLCRRNGLLSSLSPPAAPVLRLFPLSWNTDPSPSSFRLRCSSHSTVASTEISFEASAPTCDIPPSSPPSISENEEPKPKAWVSPSPHWRSGRVITEVDYAKETPSMVKFRKAPPKYKFPAILTAKHRISQSLSPDIPQQLAWDILDAVQRDVTVPWDRALYQFVMSAMGKVARYHEVVLLLHKMDAQGLRVDHAIVITALRALAGSHNESLITKVIDLAANKAIAQNFELDMALAELCASYFTKDFALEIARSLLAAPVSWGSDTALAVLRIYQRFKSVEQALDLAQMLHARKPEILCDGLVITQLHRLLSTVTPPPSAPLLLSAYRLLVDCIIAHTRPGTLMLGVLEEMLDQLAVLQASASAAKLARFAFPAGRMTPRAHLALIYSFNPVHDPVGLCDAISEYALLYGDLPIICLHHIGYVNFQDILQVDEFFFHLERMISNPVDPDQPALAHPLNINHLNIIISASAQRRDLDRSYSTYLALQSQFGMLPSRATQMLLLEACKSTSNIHAATRILSEFKELPDPALHPCREHYEALCQIASRAQRWDIIDSALDSMRQLGFWPPSVSLFSKLSFGYAAHAEFARLKATLDLSVECDRRIADPLFDRFSTMVSSALRHTYNS